MIYSDGPGPINGYRVRLIDPPDFTFDFVPNDTITGALGSWTNQNYYTTSRVIVNLGFNMASGRQYGPFGGTGGYPFSFAGNVYGIFGTYGDTTSYAPSSIGFWTDPASPPPAPPSPPPRPPSPVPAAPSPPPARNLGRIQTFAFGSTGDLLFDDGPMYSGVTGFRMWLSFDNTFVKAIQFIYAEMAGPIYGSTDNRNFNPEIWIDFERNDTISGAFGGTSSLVLVSLGFRMLSGRQYGPFGGPSFTTPFTHNGAVYSIFGSIYTDAQSVTSIGFWTDSPSPPPAPPGRNAFPASPPPPPRPPGSLPLVNNGRIQTQVFGAPAAIPGTYWDDGPFFTSVVGFRLWLSADKTWVKAIQMVYSERSGPINTYTDNSAPDVVIAFANGDRIVGAFGRTFTTNYYVLYSFGFWMASGRQYGPYGLEYGTPFRYEGNVYSIFGTTWANTQGISSIGFWSDPVLPPPPAPPFRPPPPVAPPPPARNPLWNLGRVQTFLSGIEGSTYWDDGAYYSGITGFRIWLNARTNVRAVQLIYRERPGQINGYTRLGETPAISIDFEAGDQIVGVIGSYDRNNGPILNLGFYMRSGRQYGPYGGPGGVEFDILVPTYAIFGTSNPNLQAITAIGVWTDPLPPRQLPLAALPPPPLHHQPLVLKAVPAPCGPPLFPFWATSSMMMASHLVQQD
eukprot:jgi/Botrbrau1/23593/Bobra.0141s0057.1